MRRKKSSVKYNVLKGQSCFFRSQSQIHKIFSMENKCNKIFKSSERPQCTVFQDIVLNFNQKISKIRLQNSKKHLYTLIVPTRHLPSLSRFKTALRAYNRSIPEITFIIPSIVRNRFCIVTTILYYYWKIILNIF